jgi:hypothetical protein
LVEVDGSGVAIKSSRVRTVCDTDGRVRYATTTVTGAITRDSAVYDSYVSIPAVLACRGEYSTTSIGYITRDSAVSNRKPCRKGIGEYATAIDSRIARNSAVLDGSVTRIR